jgi:hypothetical protein
MEAGDDAERALLRRGVLGGRWERGQVRCETRQGQTGQVVCMKPKRVQYRSERPQSFSTEVS